LSACAAPVCGVGRGAAVLTDGFGGAFACGSIEGSFAAPFKPRSGVLGCGPGRLAGFGAGCGVRAGGASFAASLGTRCGALL